MLTGASGFVGSHLLESLAQRDIPVVILLRESSDRSFLRQLPPQVEVRFGSISDPASLAAAMANATDVIHCAGATKARTIEGFYEVNQVGTRNVVNAVNAHPGIRRLLHISSLAAAGPGTREKPVRESDPPHPVSHYGRSKLAGEEEVRQGCRHEFTIIRPPAVYGPRDRGFLPMFAAVKRHLRPTPSAAQRLSLVYVKDLAEASVEAFLHPTAAGGTYFAAGSEVVSSRELASLIAQNLKTWTIPLPLPTFALWPVCLLKSIQAAITGKPDILGLEKFPELRAAGWVCDPQRLTTELGIRCATDLQTGIQKTISWYEQNGWI